MKKKWSGAQSDIIQKKNSSRIREGRTDDTRFGSQFDATLQVKVIRTLSTICGQIQTPASPDRISRSNHDSGWDSCKLLPQGCKFVSVFVRCRKKGSRLLLLSVLFIGR